MKTKLEDLRPVAPAQPDIVEAFIELISNLTDGGRKVLLAVNNRGKTNESSTQLSFFPEGIGSGEIPGVKLVGLLSVSQAIQDPRLTQPTTTITAYTVLDIGGYKQVAPIREIMVDLDFVDPDEHEQPEVIREILGPLRGPLGDSEVCQLNGILRPLIGVQRAVAA